MSRLDKILRERGGCLIGNRAARWNALLAYVINCHGTSCFKCLCDVHNTKRLIKEIDRVSIKQANALGT